MTNKELPMTLSLKNIDKLGDLLDCIEHIQKKEDSIYIKFKKDLILQAENHMVIHSNGGQIAIKGKKLHLNPETCICKHFKEQDHNAMIETLEKDNEMKLEKANEEPEKNENNSCSC